MTLAEFIKKYDGKGIDFDGAYGDQCMDLMHQYHVDVLGIPDKRTLAAPAAKDVYLNFTKMFNNELFEKIANSLTNIPMPGDIMLWGTGIGPYGHVAIVRDADVNKFRSFDQNFPTDSKCHIVEHTYVGVLGWLRYKGGTSMQIDNALYEKLVTNSTERDAIRSYLGVPLDPQDGEARKVKESIDGLRNLATGLQRQLSEAQTEIKNREEQVDRIKQTYEASAKTQADRIVALETAQKSFDTERQSLKGQIDEFATAKGQLAIELEKTKTLLKQEQAKPCSSLTLGDVILLFWDKIKNFQLK